jgi:hypothetical protein
MELFILPILLTSLPFDIALTMWCLQKNKRSVSILVAPAFLYFISAVIWIAISSQDPRFQGTTGILGLMMFFIVGVILTLIRLLIGLNIWV